MRVQTGAQVERSVTDNLGRTRLMERSGYGGQTETSETFYNAKGQVVRVTQPGMAASLFEYDSLGNQTRVVLDLNGNGTTEPGVDRIQFNDTHWVRWRVSR